MDDMFKEGVDLVKEEFKDLHKLMNDNFKKILQAIKGNENSETIIQHADSEAPFHQHVGELHQTIDENLRNNSPIQIDHDTVHVETEIAAIHQFYADPNSDTNVATQKTAMCEYVNDHRIFCVVLWQMVDYVFILVNMKGTNH
ncbi:hypothetical protein RND71_015392 [Anisodus tanguticus]|uniref:Uncharacterized protein n=1 Tax=Anisodus tanguticus TaxID=243964 RepID=A0AAE1S480_9SOLA|nr:hypothetical protein RND71_015392 [Anisodus tanguticus]